MGSQGRPRTYHPDRPSTTAERQRVWRRQHAAEVARLRQKARQKAYHESQRYDWETPPAVFAEYDAEFHFTLDVCASDQTAKCVRYFTPADDGLTQDWGQEICWMNPPYGDAIGKWMEKAYRSSLPGATVVCLVPARTDVQWWHAWVIDKASEVRLRKGRITFLGTDGLPAKNSAGFPSVAAIYRPFIV